MKGIIARSLGLAVSLAALSTTLLAGPAAKQPEKPQSGTPLPTDWSHQHLIFSYPRTPEQAARVQKDARYQQQASRQISRGVVSDQVDLAIRERLRRHRGRLRGLRMHRDWSVDLGPNATVGAGKFPAKYSFDITVAQCAGTSAPDFVVYGTGLTGASDQGDIVAFTNLYAGCPTGPIPGDYWSYNTGGQVLTSPVFSLDGTQLAFTQTAAGTASLVLLKWAAFTGFVQAPVGLTPMSASAYTTCTAPCMTTFSLGANDTNSSVFYDYGADTAYVGDDSGKLHQFTGVFKGTPAEMITGWPVSVSAKVLTNPIHDDNTGNTFVGDSGGFLYSVSSSGVPTASARLDYGVGLTDGPVVDTVAGSAYVFSSQDGPGSTTAGVFQLPTNFTAGSAGPEAKVGAATAGLTPVYHGAFDHNYISSTDNSGSLYVCGNPGGEPTLYQIPIIAGALGTPKAGPVLSSTGSTACSPVTDIYNPTVTGAGLPEEWVFASAQATGTPSGCLGVSCIMNFRVTSWQPNNVYNAGQLVLDSNLNIQVADNSGGTSGATPPVWQTAVFGPQTSDGTVFWRNQGALAGPTPASWKAGMTYAGAFEIVDTNNNIEIVSNVGGGTSGGTQPTWPLGEGVTTTDGGVIWYNLGANPVAGLDVSGGTSGIIMDNTVNANGTSQVYFSTLQPESCGLLGPTGGCAVQASQQGLQ